MTPTRLSIVAAAAALALLVPASTARAADGALDSSFGDGGKVETPIRGHDDTGYAVAVQPDGKIVVAGVSKASSDFAVSDYDMAVTRYLPDGTLDPDFGSDGTVVTPVVAGDDLAYALALQPDGKIVVVGQASNGANADVAVLRYLADGSLDPAFDDDGIVITAIGPGDDIAYGLALQPDGKIVVTGEASTACCGQDTAVLRYLDDGSLDPDFGGGSGMVLVGVGPDDSYGGAVAVQADGSIVIAGAGNLAGGDLDFAVFRLLSDGLIDASFGSGGTAITELSTADDRPWSLGIQPDGKIVVAGTQSDDGNGNFALARYLDDGSLDSSFGGDGTVVSAITISQDVLVAGALLLQPDGKIVVGGSTVQSSSVFAVARYLGDGSLDASFDGDGVAVLSGGPAFAYGLALQADGKIVAAGSPGAGDLVVARYLGDTVLPTNPTLASPSHTVGTAASDTTVDVTLSGASDDNTGVDGFSYEWDTVATTVPDEVKDAEEDASGLASPELVDGDSHYVHVRVRDKAGNWSDAVHLGPFWIDTVAPTRPSLGGAVERRFQTRTSFVLSWLGASDGGSGIESYEVQVKRARWSGGFGSYAVWKSAVPGTGATFAGRPGRTYCFRARSQDGADHLSAWSRTRCTAVPLDDRALTASGPWVRKTGNGYYLGTRSLSWVPGAALVKTGVRARRLAVIVTRSPDCGQIKVYWRARLVKEVDLTASMTRKKQVIGVASFDTLRSGKVRIVAASSTRAACVEGLGVSGA
jgi:uncharacterized delta-60 repeat protein